jgi:hypothetical protein
MNVLDSEPDRVTVTPERPDPPDVIRPEILYVGLLPHPGMAQITEKINITEHRINKCLCRFIIASLSHGSAGPLCKDLSPYY